LTRLFPYFCCQGAKKVVAEGGKIPKAASMLLKIPGIGDYTSGAIASIAFKEVGSFCDCASIKEMLLLML